MQGHHTSYFGDDGSYPAFGKRLRVKFHLAICDVCGFYKKQLETVRALARKLGGEEAPTQQEAVLSEEAKSKIKDSLKQTS